MGRLSCDAVEQSREFPRSPPDCRFTPRSVAIMSEVPYIHPVACPKEDGTLIRFCQPESDSISRRGFYAKQLYKSVLFRPTAMSERLQVKSSDGRLPFGFVWSYGFWALDAWLSRLRFKCAWCTFGFSEEQQRLMEEKEP